MVLYKYLSFDRLDVLQHHRIRYSQPAVLNDIFELRPPLFTIAKDDVIESKIDEVWAEEAQAAYDTLPAGIRAKIPRGLFLSACQQRRESLRGKFPETVAAFKPLLQDRLYNVPNKTLGILSLSETAANAKMWAIYADSHRGFVIGFDTAHPHFDQRKSAKDEFRYVRKVQYVAARPNKPFSDWSYEDMFLTKSSDWQNEREWRILRPLSEATEAQPAELYPIYLFEFPESTVVEVILGVNMKIDRRKIIVDALKAAPALSHVKLYEATAPAETFEMVIRPYFSDALA